MTFSPISDKDAANMWGTIHCSLYQWNSKYDDIHNILKYGLATCHLVAKLNTNLEHILACFLNHTHVPYWNVILMLHMRIYVQLKMLCFLSEGLELLILVRKDDFYQLWLGCNQCHSGTGSATVPIKIPILLMKESKSGIIRTKKTGVFPTC